jgi:8-hydroxy-5-deazaflavin:NADPH oxidoreductase
MDPGLVEPTIGILGAGQMGFALARRWVENDHRVFLGSRNLPRVQELSAALGPNACGTSYQEAAASGEVIVLAMPPHVLLDIVRDLAKVFQNKILLDCSGSAGPVSWEDRNTRASLAEQVAECAPGAHVIKALTTIPSSTLALVERYPPVKALYCGDDDIAKSTVRRLIEELELEPIDAGALSEARLFEYYASHAEWNAP